MGRLTRIKQFAIKVEGTSGTAETLAAGDVVLTADELRSTFERDMNDRDPLRSHLSNVKQIPGIGFGTISGKVELVGGGDASTKPACARVLQACGLTETEVLKLTYASGTGTPQPGEQITDRGSKEGRIVRVDGSGATGTLFYVLTNGSSDWIATDTVTGTNSTWSATAAVVTGTGVGWAYLPTSETSAAALPTFTSQLNDDGVLTKIFGALGNAQISAEGPGKLAYLNFELMGAALKPADATLLSGTSPLEIAPETFLSAGVALAGDSLCISGMNFDLGNQLVRRECANAAAGIMQYRITDREPKISVAPEAELEADRAIWTPYDAATSLTFTATVGQSEFKRAMVVAPTASLESIPYGEREGILTNDATLRLNGDQPEGDDEYIIAFL